MFEVTLSGESWRLSPSPSRFWPLPCPTIVVVEAAVPGIGAAGGGREGGGGGVAGGGGGAEGREGVEGGEDGGARAQKIGAGEAALSTVAPMALLSAVALVTTAWSATAIAQAEDWSATSMVALTCTLAAVTLRVMSPAVTP